MDGTDVTEVCRLCPSTQGLLSIFGDGASIKNNMKEVILVTTGIEILENDLVSKKMCQRCCSITLKMFQFRQDAIKQDRELKEKCNQYLGDKGLRLPNTCVTIKQEKRELFESLQRLKKEHLAPTPSTSKACLKEKLHPSIKQLYQTFPHLKLPKACVERHMAPVVSLPMGHVEKYFKKRKLNMKQFTYKPRSKTLTKEIANRFAKKRTSVPPKEKKTVAPLKISKKLFEPHKKATNTLESYVCTQVHKEKTRRKRSVSSSESDPRHKSKMIKQTERNEGKTAPPMAVDEKIATTEGEKSTTTLAPLPPVSAPPKTSSVDSTEPRKVVRIATPSVDHSEESRDSLATNLSVGTTSSDGNLPDFLESFGLTPTVTTTKSQTLLVCNLCASVHNNAFELKRHSSKHMVCQFCKRRFKSLEAKDDHIDSSCEVKKMMNSSSPIVSLEPIHLNLDIRKKYKEAFSTFELISGLQEVVPVEEVIVRAVSPPIPEHRDNVIVLSDDDDTQTGPADPLSGIPTPSANMPPPAIEAVVYNTVSIVRPDVRIKKADPIFNNLPANLTDTQLLKKLTTLLKPKSPTVEKMLQTDLPANRDIRINNLEGTCEFKNLKEQLLTYKIPVSISNGGFHVGYQFKNKPQPKKKVANWNALPIIDAKGTYSKTKANSAKKNTSIEKPAPAKTSQPNIQLLITNTQPQTIVAGSSPAPPMHLPPLPHNTVIQTTAPQSLNRANVPVSQPSVNVIAMNCVSSNSATPLLQNYALSVSPSMPVVSRPLPIPKTFVTSATRNSFHNTSVVTPGSPVNKNYPQRNSLPSSFPNNNAPPPQPSPFPNNNAPPPQPSPFPNNNAPPPQPSPFPNNNAPPPQKVPLPNLVAIPPPAYNRFPPNGGLPANNSLNNPPRMVPLLQPSANANQTITIPDDDVVPTTVPSDASKFRVKNVWELQ